MTANPTSVLRNGKAYSWASVTVNIAGVDVIGIRAISYSENQSVDAVYGVGNKPIAYGTGNITYEGSITLLAEEVRQLQEAAPKGRLQEIPPFSIPVVLEANGIVMTDRLDGVVFKSNGRDMSQGDTTIETEIELFIGSIQWHS
ncbi:MAG: hypothetical protein AAF587_29625 [Bacteroidota bacterium]